MKKKEPDIYDAIGELRAKEANKLLDLEITVKCVIGGAASRAQLKDYYKDDPLTCAKELADNEQGLCGTIDCHQFEIVDAKVKQP